MTTSDKEIGARAKYEPPWLTCPHCHWKLTPGGQCRCHPGWVAMRDALKRVTEEAERLRHDRNVATGAAANGIWIWSETDDNELESMGDDMVVTMRAATLREMIAAARSEALEVAARMLDERAANMLYEVDHDIIIDDAEEVRRMVSAT